MPRNSQVMQDAHKQCIVTCAQAADEHHSQQDRCANRTMCISAYLSTSSS